MANSKSRTTFAKLNREAAVRERQLRKQAKKEAKKHAPTVPEESTGDAPSGEA